MIDRAYLLKLIESLRCPPEYDDEVILGFALALNQLLVALGEKPSKAYQMHVSWQLIAERMADDAVR